MATEKPDNSSVIIFLFIENLNIAVPQEPRAQCRKYTFIYFISFSNDNLRQCFVRKKTNKNTNDSSFENSLMYLYL